MSTRHPVTTVAAQRHAVRYRRVSTGHQGASLEAQEANHLAYCQLKGLSIVGDFSDEAVSGKVPLWDRAGGRDLLEFIRRNQAGSRPVTDLIVTKLDRIGRRAKHVLTIIEDLTKLGVTVHFTDFGGDSISTAGAVGKLIITILAACAEFELTIIQDRTIEVLQHKLAAGYCTGTIPYGWDAIETDEVNTKTGKPLKKLVTNEAEQAVIAEMRMMRDAKHSFSDIARLLNERGIRTKNAGAVIKKRRFTTDADGKRVAVKGEAGLYSVPTTGEWTHAAVQSVLENKLNAAGIRQTEN